MVSVTVGAQMFSYIGGAAKRFSFYSGVQNAITNQTPFIFFCSGGLRRAQLL